MREVTKSIWEGVRNAGGRNPCERLRLRGALSCPKDSKSATLTQLECKEQPVRLFCSRVTTAKRTKKSLQPALGLYIPLEEKKGNIY